MTGPEISADHCIWLGITERELKKWARDIKASWKERAAVKKASNNNAFRNADNNPQTN